MRLVECVPNFSEGRDSRIIEAIADAIRSVEGAFLLDVDPGRDTNRTVYTFVGAPEPVAEAAFAAIRCGAALIDMRRHKGAHARQGACDVCPFVPLGDTTMEECVQLSKRVARRVADELGIPTFLYEHSATRPERRSIVDIRVGEYEALEEKLKTPEFCPDFGPARFNACSGATVVGARDFLIAYNINLNTRDPRIAKDIALVIRDKGRFERDQEGKKVRGTDGGWLRSPGMFQHCKATGWYIADYRCAQVTMNLTNVRETPVHRVFDAVCALAAERGCRVTGSEIVGLVPLDVMLSAGDHYLARSGASRGVNESERVETAIRSLGLNDVAPFDPAKKIVEYRIGPRIGELMALTCSAFVDETASDSPAPGGGSVAALCGALSAALTAMVGVLTYGKKGFGEAAPRLEHLGQRAQELKQRFSRAVDDDAAAFHRVMGAMRLPRQTPEEEAFQKDAMEAATQEAILVPLSVLEDSVEAAQLAAEMVRIGNPNSVSDAGVASLCARVAARGAHYNVLINVPGSTDEGFVGEVKERAERAWAEAAATCDATESAMLTRLHPQPQR